MRLIALHADYLCRHSGVCCAEPWAIPVERVRHARLQSALASGSLRPAHTHSTFVEPAEGIDPDAIAVVGRAGRDCVFFERDRGRLCAIHRDLGHAALPSACQHFPRVVAIDPRGVTLSLSHVCPTVGDLLLADDAGWNRFVDRGRVVIDGLEWSGLDAREALPPQVNGVLLWDWESMTAFDEHALDLLGRKSPEQALGVIDAVATALSRLERGEVRPRMFDAFAEAEATAPPLEPAIASLTDLAERCTSGAFPAAALPDGLARSVASTQSEWVSVSPQVARYLAARLLASAVMYHALHVRVWSLWMQASYAVLRSAFAREYTRTTTVSGHAALKAAAADADRLLVHRLDPGGFAAALLTRSAVPSSPWR
jgi:Fe-S-cluster containining protein